MATVRTHVRRGLQQVRERMDKRHGHRRAWLALLAVPWDSPVPAMAMFKSWLLKQIIGVVLMFSKAKTPLLIVAVLLVGFTAATVFIDDSQESELDKLKEGPVVVQAKVVENQDRGIAEEPSIERLDLRSRLKTERTTTSDHGYGQVAVYLTWQDDGLALEGIVVRLEPAVADGFARRMEATTNSDGKALFDRAPAGRVFVRMPQRTLKLRAK